MKHRRTERCWGGGMPSKGLSSPAAIPTPMGDRIPPGNKVLVRENNPPAPLLTRPRQEVSLAVPFMQTHFALPGSRKRKGKRPRTPPDGENSPECPENHPTSTSGSHRVCPTPELGNSA